MKMLKKILGTFKKRSEIKFVVIPRDVCRLTIDEWKTNKDYVTLAQKTLADTNVRLILDVLRNSSPANEVMMERDLGVRAVKQAQIEGYMMALNNLESLAVFEQPRPELESEFVDPGREEEQISHP